MLEDCRNHKIELIITKSISRFGRNTVETLDVLNKLRVLDIDVFFESENIHTHETKHIFLISLLEAAAQAESESKSKNIKWGIDRKLKNGDSKLYNRKCFGYQHSEEGNLIIAEEEAKIVLKIFDLYLNGYSILAIIRELENQNIKSPTGRDRWSKRTIETMLSKEKYTGNVLVGKTYCEDYPNNQRLVNNGERQKYLATGNHPSIISDEQFERVKAEKARRSNIQVDENGITRKNTHYSMKKFRNGSE